MLRRNSEKILRVICVYVVCIIMSLVLVGCIQNNKNAVQINKFDIKEVYKDENGDTLDGSNIQSNVSKTRK